MPTIRNRDRYKFPAAIRARFMLQTVTYRDVSELFLPTLSTAEACAIFATCSKGVEASKALVLGEGYGRILHLPIGNLARDFRHVPLAEARYFYC